MAVAEATLNGILLIDKPILYTSHDIVDVVRRKVGFRRVGHAGTLDPMATGLLVILLGAYTSMFERFSSEDKGYEGILTLGVQTRTQDLEGQIIGTGETRGIKESEIRKVFKRFTGTIVQEAPQFSSARVQGVKAYKLARKQKDFTPPSKTVFVKRLDMLRYTEPDVYFRAEVSKGTYLRTLASDIGSAIGTGAVLSSLRRTRSGSFGIEEGVTTQRLERMTVSEIKAHSAKQAAKLHRA